MEDAIRVTRADGQIAAAVDIGPSSATNLLEISAETVTLSAGAQGTTGTVCLDKAPVFNEVGSQIGELSDTSFAFVTGTVLTTEEEWDYTKLDAAQIALLDNGDFRIDYRTGKMLYCKDTAATTDTCNYKSRQTNIEITASTISIGSVTIEDASTSANKADINDADTARTTGTHVLATQSVDAAGAVLSTSALATSAKQLADDHNVTVSNMIPAVETGLATSAKQLADDHNVTVSNMIAPVETGLATSIKQLADGHGVAVADGADVTQGAKADNKNSATDTTAISIMAVLKQLSFSMQANAGNTEVMDDWDDENRCAMVKSYQAGYYSTVDTSFVTGDSPVTLDVNTALSRNAEMGYIVNDGAGNFTISLSENGTDYGSEIIMENGETLSLEGLDVDSIRITWVADSAYRVFAK